MVLTGELLSEVYDELHRLASSFLRNERLNHTLQPSALINEAYIRLMTHRTNPAVDRHHFLRLAARAMRHVLIDYSRRHRATKRDSALQLITDSNAAPGAAEPEDYLTIHDALTKLEAVDPQLANVVELRFFGGLSVEETAEVLEVSATTVKREWSVAKAWLRSELAAGYPAQDEDAGSAHRPGNALSSSTRPLWNCPPTAARTMFASMRPMNRRF